jgi:hypothetical protein
MHTSRIDRHSRPKRARWLKRWERALNALAMTPKINSPRAAGVAS